MNTVLIPPLALITDLELLAEEDTFLQDMVPTKDLDHFVGKRFVVARAATHVEENRCPIQFVPIVFKHCLSVRGDSSDPFT